VGKAARNAPPRGKPIACPESATLIHEGLAAPTICQRRMVACNL